MARNINNITRNNKAAHTAASIFEPLEDRTMYSATPVMGYLQDWKIASGSYSMFAENSSGAVTSDHINWNELTQVNYFSLRPNADGSLQTLSNGHIATASGDDANEQLPSLVTEAKSNNPNVKVFVTVGGGDGTSISEMTALINNPSAFGTFASNMQSFCNTYKLSGVDLDWEPVTATKTEIDNFGTLISTLQGKGLTVSAAVLSDPVALTTGGEAFELNNTAVSDLSSINVMAYASTSESQADGFMAEWKAYLSGTSIDGNTSTDVDGNTLHQPVSKLQYGMDDVDDSTNTASVVKGKVDTTLSAGYGGLFLWDLDSDTNGSIVSEISAELAAKGGTAPTQPTQPVSTGGSISGSIKTASGAAVSGVTVYLDTDNDSKLDNNEQSTTTTSTGSYSFSNVPVGATIVRQVLPTGDTQVAPSSNLGIHLTVSNGSNFTNENFTDTVPATTKPMPNTGSVSGSVKSTSGAAVSGITVYLDANNDSKQDNGELTATTGSTGSFSFSNVPIGAYIVRQELATGDTQTSPSNGYGIHISVTAGSTLSGENFIDSVAKTTTPTTPTTGQLHGTAIAASISSNSTLANAFDGNLSTTYHSNTASGNWIGLDLGSAATITQIQFAAAASDPWNMEGGIFQASNTADFSSGVVTLYTIGNSAAPSSSSLNVANITASGAYRYVRYLAPGGSYGDIAEMEVFGTI
jgi:hypothetical protein